MLEPWEENELKAFLVERCLGYFRIVDVTNQMYLYVDDNRQLRSTSASGSAFIVSTQRQVDKGNSDDMYWTRSGDDLIENKNTGS